jgi:hypothetical protein
MHPDNEISALNYVYESLKGLNNAQIKRILDWVKDKFDLDKPPGLRALERKFKTEIPMETAQSPTAVVEAAAKPIKKRRGRRSGKSQGRPAAQTKPVIDEPAPQLAESPLIQGFLKYDNFEELSLFSTANTNTAKILLAAVYLQENKNYKEFGSYDISALFKEIGEEIGHPSPALSYLMSKNPPMVIQTGTEGPGEKSRRNFRVTEEGLRIARNYIKE